MRPLLVVVGPSGVGKSTIVKELVSRNAIQLLPTWTTRPVRGDEDCAPEHVFCTEEELRDALLDGRVLEVMPLFGLPYKYGLPRIEVADSGPVTVLMARAFLLPELDRHTQNYMVYHIECEKSLVEKRLSIRSAGGAELGSRLDIFDHEVELGRKVASRIFINNEPVHELIGQILKSLQTDFGLES